MPFETENIKEKSKYLDTKSYPIELGISLAVRCLMIGPSTLTLENASCSIKIGCSGEIRISIGPDPSTSDVDTYTQTNFLYPRNTPTGWQTEIRGFGQYSAAGEIENGPITVSNYPTSMAELQRLNNLLDIT